MNEENSLARERRESVYLDERLSAYYGPPLPEQPLSSSTWQSVRNRLAPRRSLKYRFVSTFRRRYFRHSTVPAFVQSAFSRIAYEARLPYTHAMLSCRLKLDAHVPAIRVSLLSRRPIKLMLPVQLTHSMEAVELDVLLATGLAQYLCMRKLTYIVPRLLFGSILPLVCILVVLFQQNIPRSVFPIAISLCIILCALVSWLLYIQKHRLVFRADTFMVLWLGRTRVCQGLHALADRSSSFTRRQWSEPTLAERIQRICGTRVSIEDERLTLVR